MTTPMIVPGTFSKLPFAKYKPGMRVWSDSLHAFGAVVAKHKGTETITVLEDGAHEPRDHTAADLALAPVDALDQIHPMLAKNIKDYTTITLEQVLDDDLWVMEKKYDGERQILTFVPDDDAAHLRSDEFQGHVLSDVHFRATSRVVGKHTGRLGVNTGHLTMQGDVLARFVPQDGITVFDGEATCSTYPTDAENFKIVASVMRSLPTRALEVQKKHGALGLRLYDVLWFDGADLRQRPFGYRRMTLQTWYAEARSRAGASGCLGVFDSVVSVAPQARGCADKRAMLDQSVSEGWEGVMFKHADATYTDSSKKDQRSPCLLKHKPFEDTEVVILGFVQGQGEYNTDKFGAVSCGQWVPRQGITPEMAESEVFGSVVTHPKMRALIDRASREGLLRTHMLIEVATASGFTAAQEAEFRTDPAAFIGGVATVKYQVRHAATARMRHPHYKAMRAETDALTVIYAPTDA